ncbi:MAG TPA: vitamin K epoxide reductase family protein [Candidatus Dormibacteraeota bacterium]|nr:vitamin K epoxide reductase family protein [Candidatus Dormibacteraeota bacterium]
MSDLKRYVQPSVATAALVGLGVSVYLTFVHFQAAQLYCAVSGAIDCERVLRSGFAVIAGTTVPTSVAGIVWFAVGTVLTGARISAPSRPGLGRAQMAWSAVGLLTVLYLVFIEIVEIGAICAWCTVAHVMVVLIFILTVTIRPSTAT